MENKQIQQAQITPTKVSKVQENPDSILLGSIQRADEEDLLTYNSAHQLTGSNSNSSSEVSETVSSPRALFMSLKIQDQISNDDEAKQSTMRFQEAQQPPLSPAPQPILPPVKPPKSAQALIDSLSNIKPLLIRPRPTRRTSSSPPNFDSSYSPHGPYPHPDNLPPPPPPPDPI